MGGMHAHQMQGVQGASDAERVWAPNSGRAGIRCEAWGSRGAEHGCLGARGKGTRAPDAAHVGVPNEGHTGVPDAGAQAT